MTQEETLLWHETLAQGPVSPESAVGAKGPAKKKQSAEKPKPLPRAEKKPAPAFTQPQPFDRRVLSQLRRGVTKIQATLDLHGHTQISAYQALLRFVERSQSKGRTDVLVITGKGRVGDGILRGLLPRWLAESPLREAVLSCEPAAAHHGGMGAWYLKIRKRKQ